MNSVMRFIVWGVMPLGALLGGALATWFGLRAAIWVGAVGMSLAVLPVLLSPVRTLREMPEPVEEPLPSEADAAGGLVPAAAGALPPASDAPARSFSPSCSSAVAAARATWNESPSTASSSDQTLEQGSTTPVRRVGRYSSSCTAAARIPRTCGRSGSGKELERLGPRAPAVLLVDGGDHSYYHDRRDGPWGEYVFREAIPAALERLRADPDRVAIGGISMGGFGALDLARLHPGRFCAVGGHSPALWRTGGETPAGAFDDAEDFSRHDLFDGSKARPRRGLDRRRPGRSVLRRGKGLRAAPARAPEGR